MRGHEIDTMMFFNRHPNAFPIYDALEELIFTVFPGVNKRVHKTQISFSNRHVFACISFTRVKKKQDLPDPYIVITLGLPCAIDSSRIAVKSEPYPGRWTTHIVIGSVDEIDKELVSWIRQAYSFAESK